MKIVLAFFLLIISNISHSESAPTLFDANVIPHASVISHEDCFSGVFSSYKSWKEEMVFGKGIKELAFQQRFPESNFNQYKDTVQCYLFVYEVEQHLVKGFVLYPKGLLNEKLPSIIYNRGGNNVNSHTLKFGNLFFYHFPLALEGNVVISSQYGGAMVWPKNFKGNGGVDEYGGVEVKDVLALIPILDSMPITDPNRIAMFGWSRGSMMSLIAVTKTNRIKTLVLGATPVDLVLSAINRPSLEHDVFKRLIPGYEFDKLALLEERSAIYWPEKIPKDISILMLHGTNDERTSIVPVFKFADTMKSLGVNIELKEFPSGSHTLIESKVSVYRKVLSWFNEHL